MSRREKPPKIDRATLRTIAAEQLLINAIPEIEGERVLCTSLGRAQFAAALAAFRPQTEVTCHFFDVFLADDSREMQRAGEAGAKNLTIVCTADFPGSDYDAVAIPVSTGGDAELTRDILQSGHIALREGGRLFSSTWNKEDNWLHDELRKLFPKVTRRPTPGGILYIATKTEPLKKIKNHDAEFAFRDEGRLIKAISRPGIFSHRSIDAGAALLNTMVVRENYRVLDIGCGSGVVGLAAAFRAPGVKVVGVDSNARATQCLERGAVLNELTNITTKIDAEGECGESGTFDLVVGNPPYFSDFRIAEIFLHAARKALKPGGKVLMVTKSSTWFEQRMGELFDKINMQPHKMYMVAEGVQGRSAR